MHLAFHVFQRIFSKEPLVKKKISIITPSLNGGGAEKVAVNLANHFADSDYSVDLVVFKLIGPYQSLVNKKVNLVNLSVSRTRYVFFRIRKYLRTNREARVLSVIRDANIFVGFAAYGLKIKRLAFREANTMNAIDNSPQPKKSIYKFLMKVAYKRADRIISNSEDTKTDLVKSKIIPEEKAIVIRNPVLDPSFIELKSEKLHDPWFLDEGTKVILSVGRLHRQKNFSFLISVFKEVHEINSCSRLVIVGEGEEKQRLFDLIKTEGLSEVVRIIEFQKNIYPYYENADVFALTSEWEGFGNVLVEALSVGLPIVSTNCPGGPKMVLENGKYGELVPLGDKKAYVKALLAALENPIKRQESINYAHHYSVEKVAREYLKVMDITN